MTELQRAVVGLVVAYQEYDADRPWAKRKPAVRWAQAAVIEGGLLLTSTQMIADATLVEVEVLGRPPRAVARVVHVDQEISLALLAIDDEALRAELEPLALASATPVTGSLRTIRWSNQQFEVAPLRPKKVSVGEGWFGRLRHAFLLGRCDLPDGGWAEPVVDDDDALVGLTIAQNEHTSWVVPVEILAAYVRHALSAEPYRPFASLRVAWQWTMDRALSAWVGLGDAPRGVMIERVPRGSTGHGVLRPRDVLLELDGHAVDSRGYYAHPRWGSLEFTHVVIEGHRAGDAIGAKVLRDGVEHELELVLRESPTHGELVPGRRGGEPPPYAVAGALVFLELDGDYLRTWGSEWWTRAPLHLLTAYQLLEGRQTPERRRLIVLSRVLPVTWAIGYQHVRDLLVARIDGRPIGSVSDVLEAFAAARGPLVRVEFEPNEERSELVVDVTRLEAVTAEVLEDFGIPAAHRLPLRPPPELD